MNHPINVGSVEFFRQLDAIEPGAWGTPCSLVLLDGNTIDWCLAWENARFSDAGKWINPHSVAYLTECPKRMPGKFARLLKEVGESGMGYHIYVVHLSDGNSFVHTAGNLAIDLVNLPIGYMQKDIIGVEPHEGRDRVRTEGCRNLVFNDHGASLEYARSLA